MTERRYRLNEKQRLFVREYLQDCNATKATIRAGYSPRSANTNGPRMLVNVGIAAEIRREQAKKAEKLDVSADQVLQEAARIGFSRLTDFVQVLPGNKTRVTPTADLTDDMVAALAEISQGGQGQPTDYQNQAP